MLIFTCRRLLLRAILLIISVVSILVLLSGEVAEHDHLNLQEPELVTKGWLPASHATVDLTKLNYSQDSAPSCDDSYPPYLVILVHSSPSHFLHRSTIRKTWGSASAVMGQTIRILFLVGEAEKRIHKRLDYEMLEHRDLVRGTFYDSYRNLTYKHLLGYQWLLSNCRKAALAMKTDDDVFVDVHRAIRFLLSTFGSHPQSLLAGMLVPSGSLPRRSGKWTVTRVEYPQEVYPEYLSGMAYFITPENAQKVLLASKHLPFFWIDDIFVTGFAADAAGVKKLDLGVWFAREEGHLLKWLDSSSLRPCTWFVAELTPRRWPHDVLRLWAKTSEAWRAKSLNKSRTET